MKLLTKSPKRMEEQNEGVRVEDRSRYQQTVVALASSLGRLRLIEIVRQPGIFTRLLDECFNGIFPVRNLLFQSSQLISENMNQQFGHSVFKGMFRQNPLTALLGNEPSFLCMRQVPGNFFFQVRDAVEGNDFFART